MKILLVHNYYGSTAPSGENRVFEAEREMLRSAGYTVEVYVRHSDEIRVSEGGVKRWRWRKIWGLVKGAVCTIVNPFAALALARKCREFKPDVVHFHNTFPLISPMAVWAASRYAPVVATLHNYRTVCAAGIPMREGKVCVSCIEKKCICGAIKHKCYRGSLLATLPLAINIAIWRRVWKKCVTKFICLTPFAKEMMVQAGLPEDKIVVKGNSIEDVRSRYKRTRDDGKLRFLYAGRMSDEKGPQVLVEAWNKMGKDVPELLMIGDGDERGRYEAMVKSSRIKFVGQKSREEVLQAVVDADVIVVPSLCYEGLPTNILEAFMLGRPCLVSNLGALPSIVKDGVSGWTFKAGDAEDLIRTIQSVGREELDKRGIAARVEYEKHYTVSANLLAAEKVYRNVKGECQDEKDVRFDILRVIGLICILLCHYASHIDSRLADGVHDVLAPMGNFIFFLISGILMGMKWDASGKAKHGVSFLVRCFKRIYYPLWWFLGLYFAIMCFVGIRIPFKSAVINVFGGCWLSKMYGCGHLWFITLILSFYAIVFIISRWGGVRKVAQCAIVVACLAVLQWLLWAKGIKQAYIVAFWLPGCLMFLFNREFDMLVTWLKQRRVVATVLGLALAALGYAGIVMLTDTDFIARSWIGAFCGVMLIAIFLVWCRKDLNVPLIGFVSGISFDIYLSHSLLRFDTVRNACGNDFLWFFVYIVGAFAIGTMLKYSREKFLGLFTQRGCER